MFIPLQCYHCFFKYYRTTTIHCTVCTTTLSTKLSLSLSERKASFPPPPFPIWKGPFPLLTSTLCSLVFVAVATINSSWVLKQEFMTKICEIRALMRALIGSQILFYSSYIIITLDKALVQYIFAIIVYCIIKTSLTYIKYFCQRLRLFKTH